MHKGYCIKFGQNLFCCSVHTKMYLISWHCLGAGECITAAQILKYKFSSLPAVTRPELKKTSNRKKASSWLKRQKIRGVLQDEEVEVKDRNDLCIISFSIDDRCEE